MSVENVQKFFELVKTNEELAQEIEKIKNEAQNKAGTVNYEQIISENVIPMAKEHGLDFTLEDFLKYSSSVAPQGELSDDDLLNVSGGWSGSQMLATGLMLLTLGSSGLSMMGSIQGAGGSSNDGGQGMAPAPTSSYSMSIDNPDEAAEDAIRQEVEQEILNNIEKSSEDVSTEADEVVENNAEKINTAEEGNESAEDVSSNEDVATTAQKDTAEATEKEAENDEIEMDEEEINLDLSEEDNDALEDFFAEGANNEEAENEATEENDFGGGYDDIMSPEDIDFLSKEAFDFFDAEENDEEENAEKATNEDDDEDDDDLV